MAVAVFRMQKAKIEIPFPFLKTIAITLTSHIYSDHFLADQKYLPDHLLLFYIRTHTITEKPVPNVCN